MQFWVKQLHLHSHCNPKAPVAFACLCVDQSHCFMACFNFLAIKGLYLHKVKLVKCLLEWTLYKYTPLYRFERERVWLMFDWWIKSVIKRPPHNPSACRRLSTGETLDWRLDDSALVTVTILCGWLIVRLVVIGWLVGCEGAATQQISAAETERDEGEQPGQPGQPGRRLSYS